MPGLLSSFRNIGRPRILVVGDLMLDRYTSGDAERVSPEAPVIVLRADHDEVRPGGAASVAYLLRHLDVDVATAGVIGNDADGTRLRALMQSEGIDDRLVLVDPTRRTTAKHRFIGRASDRHPHQMLRVDHESRAPLEAALQSQLGASLISILQNFDAILIADYLKGVCTESILQLLITSSQIQKIPVLVDPGRMPDYGRYRGATLLKPNRLEAELASGEKIDSVVQALHCAAKLRAESEVTAVMITLDREGLVVATAQQNHKVASQPRTVYDITGAGDMVLATLGLCMAVGIPVFDAAELANVAGGIEVEKFGIAPVKRAEIEAKMQPFSETLGRAIVTGDEILHLCQEYRRRGMRIVFTNGCFDLLHIGHVTFLQEAAEMGDILIVAVNSDSSVRRLKGPARPIVSEEQRIGLLSALSCVDHVVCFAEDTPISLIRRIRPDVLVKGGTTGEIVGREIVENYGGIVHRARSVDGVSTTQLIAHANRADAVSNLTNSCSNLTAIGRSVTNE